MNANELGQTLLVAPETPFSEIARALETLGWHRESRKSTTASLIAGEPEIAEWTWPGGKPFVIYTFNPVARLRVLDVATAPPSLRKMIAEKLPMVEPAQVAGFMAAASPRIRLLGLWAAQETERVDLLPNAKRLQSDNERAVAREADKVVSRLEQIAAAQLKVLNTSRILAEAARELILNLGDPATVLKLQPGKKDCTKLFDRDLAPGIAREAARLYKKPGVAAPGDRYPNLDITAAPAGLLRWPNELSRKFPGGYRNIAGWMTPNRVWLTWAFRSQDGGSVRFDGLAWVDDHWVWIPKPFRIVAPLTLKQGPR